MSNAIPPAPCRPSLEPASADDLPPAIRASLARHRENLAAMVKALEAVGMDDAAIETHLSVVIGSYRAELSRALEGIGAAA